jgi:DMSO/TMAO reductase YedYZ heme-binding membrane subunit
VSATAATLGPTAYWYLTRATGMVSLLLLTAILVLGVLGPMRVSAAPRWPRFAIDSLHRDLSLLAIAVIAVHVVTTVLDGFAPIGLLDAVVPFHSIYRPIWLGLGAFAFDLMLALVITSLVRRRLGYRAWRAVHWLAYASWPIAVLHGLGTGSDSAEGWALGITLACVLAVTWAILARLRRAESLDDGRRGAGIAAGVLMAIGMIVFTVIGPLRAGWAKRAGTPASLLTNHTVAVARATRAPAGTAVPVNVKLRVPFTATLTGTVTQTTTAAGAILDIETRLSGAVTGQLRIRLGGQPTGGAGLSLTGSQVDLVAAGLRSAMQGKVATLEGTHVTARVTGAGQTPVDLTAQLQIDDRTGVVSGRVEGVSAG